MPKQIAEDVKDARLAELQAELFRQQTVFNASLVGRTVPILFDKTGRYPGQIAGRSPFLQAVHTDGPASLIGRLADVTIEAASQNSLSGQLAFAPAEAA